MPSAARCPKATQAAVYRRRRPERTVLYQTVQAHLETWLVRKSVQEDGYAVPPWVEREFRAFPAGAILARGAAPTRCGSALNTQLESEWKTGNRE
jgi:hypothetical protein